MAASLEFFEISLIDAVAQRSRIHIGDVQVEIGHDDRGGHVLDHGLRALQLDHCVRFLEGIGMRLGHGDGGLACLMAIHGFSSLLV